MMPEPLQGRHRSRKLVALNRGGCGLQHRQKLLLKRIPGVVGGLIGDVLLHTLQLRWADAKRSIAFLPGKQAICLPHPSAGVRLQGSHRIRQCHIRRQDHEYVDVVFCVAHLAPRIGCSRDEHHRSTFVKSVNGVSLQNHLVWLPQIKRELEMPTGGGLRRRSNRAFFGSNGRKMHSRARICCGFRYKRLRIRTLGAAPGYLPFQKSDPLVPRSQVQHSIMHSEK
jgi:hypothetical protein